ncbi:MAG TPA: aspartate aminotransferase family protein, partial [Anaerolineae bacterium]|nr:aspartate aminotransferase family protein [Anaerolineae bacterium]
MQKDKSFLAENGLEVALNLLRTPTGAASKLPAACPDQGIGELATLDLLAPHVFGRSAHLNGPSALAHMDPPTPWITWATTLWNASLNQNLLHPATAPFAREAEKLVIDWLTPSFGMNGGHFCSGSTLANLTALWAARDAQHITQIVASTSAHLSIKKAARILGLPFVAIPTNAQGQLDTNKLPDLTNACLVLTAGTT